MDPAPLRRPGPGAGVGTALVVLSIGGAATYMAGTAWGLAMGVVAAIWPARRAANLQVLDAIATA